MKCPIDKPVRRVFLRCVGICLLPANYQVTVAPEPGKFILRGVLHQSGVPASFRTAVPVFVDVPDGYRRLGWIPVRGPETPFKVTLPFRPTKVTLNEWEDVLATIK